jgi:cytochrome c oxidase subunit 2
MLVLKRLIAFVVTGVTVIAAGGVARAGLGQPTPWELGLQTSASPVMDDIAWFHDFLLWLIAAIVLFVLALLAIVVVKFNARSNPVPSRTTHNTAIEIIWTVVPVLILVTVAVPSFRLLFYQLKVPPAEVTVKATGKQWFWSYSYPDSKFEFDSLMLQDKDRKAGQPRLLAVDNEMVVPVNKVVRVQVIGADVRHQDRRHSRPPQRDLVQGGTRRHVLRTVFAALRARSRVHADRCPRREPAGIHRLARAGEEEIRRR